MARSWKPINDISLEHVIDILESSAEVVLRTMDHDAEDAANDEGIQIYKEELSRILAK